MVLSPSGPTVNEVFSKCKMREGESGGPGPPRAGCPTLVDGTSCAPRLQGRDSLLGPNRRTPGRPTEPVYGNEPARNTRVHKSPLSSCRDLLPRWNRPWTVYESVTFKEGSGEGLAESVTLWDRTPPLHPLWDFRSPLQGTTNGDSAVRKRISSKGVVGVLSR